MRARLVVPLVALTLFAVAWAFGERIWSPSAAELARRRNALASARSEAAIQVALVRTSHRSTVQAFVDGARMAEAEINNAGGVTLFDAQTPFKRPLSIREYDAPAAERGTSERVKATITLARQIAADPNVVAVMGHSFDAAAAASVIYNAAGVIYFATRNTDPDQTLHRDMPYVFRVCPNDNDVMNEMAELVPNLVKKSLVGRKKVGVLLLYPDSKSQPAHGNPVERLKSCAKSLIGTKYVDFTVQGLSYDPNSVEKVFQNLETEKLIRDTERFNVLMIADLSVAATTLRERIEEVWTSHLLGERETQKLYQPKIFDLGDLVGNEDQKAELLSLPAQTVEVECERMVRLILKETKQNAVVLFEGAGSETAAALQAQSSTTVASRSSYGKQLIAHLQEDVPITEDSVEALCQISVLNVTLARSYDPTAMDFAEVVAEVAKAPKDYVYVVGSNRSALELIKQLRRAGVQTPVITSPRLEEQLRRATAETPITDTQGALDDETPEKLGATYVATTFDAWSDAPHVTTFLSKYKLYLERIRGVPIGDVQNEHPGTAAYGYVSVQLLRRAFEAAKTASPQEAARSSPGCLSSSKGLSARTISKAVATCSTFPSAFSGSAIMTQKTSSMARGPGTNFNRRRTALPRRS